MRSPIIMGGIVTRHGYCCNKKLTGYEEGTVNSDSWRGEVLGVVENS
jgi:hypothetical protein